MSFFEIFRKCTSFHWNVNHVSDENNMSRQFFNTLVGMGSRSPDFDHELKISFLILSSDALSKTSILDLISGFCTGGIFCTLSGNLERLVSILSTKHLEKWSQSDFTDVNSGRAGGGILWRMLFIEFHRQRGLSEFSEIPSAKFFPLTLKALKYIAP